MDRRSLDDHKYILHIGKPNKTILPVLKFHDKDAF